MGPDRVLQWLESGKVGIKVDVFGENGQFIERVPAGIALRIARQWACQSIKLNPRLIRTITVPAGVSRADLRELDFSELKPVMSRPSQSALTSAVAAAGSRWEAERYRALRDADGSHTEEQWQEILDLYGNKCLHCGIDGSTESLTKDHVTPISKGGSNRAGNLQPLCRSCNSRKGSRDIDYRTTFPFTRGTEKELAAV